ncbi:bifunctional metallophosphatase/5'-nucleotidase [Alkalihalobacillus oceani]|uniref:Bifunctional metallophosphatase/5'-nucleotidase n=2 Tax=Bacillaceae TaxID=186817 RepID=A0A9X2DPF4_9BACI|nr:bifunctional metallophosphatase/5'-nucleotidase [Halalkalibacter oceani]
MAVKRLTLFHTNDIHSCFEHWAQVVAHIKNQRDENTLYFDLGDHADRSNPVTEASIGQGNTRLLNEAQVDYVTIGNNEGITFAKEQLEHLYDEAAFPVVLANLFEQNGRRPDWVRPTALHRLDNGLTVGLIGVTAPFTTFYQQLGWRIAPPKPVLKEQLVALRQEADIVILLSHLGLFRDEEIAAEFEEIDVIIGAHTHHVLPAGKRVVGTLIAQAGKFGAYLGQVQIEYDTESQQVVESEATLVDISKSPEDERTKTLLADMKAETERLLAEQVAVLPERLPVDWQARTKGTQFLCDALTEWCDQELGMMHAGVLLEALEAGVITKGDIHRVCPHPINPCVVELTGRQLEETVKRAFTKELRQLELKGFGFRGKVLGQMIFTGIEVDVTAESVHSITILGEKLRADQIYSIATLDMYTFGHLLPAVADSATKRYFMPEFLRDILAWKLSQQWGNA